MLMSPDRAVARKSGSAAGVDAHQGRNPERERETWLTITMLLGPSMFCYEMLRAEADGRIFSLLGKAQLPSKG